MRNKIFKGLTALVFTVMIFALNVSASGTVFSVLYSDPSKKEVNISVSTDTVKEIGGIDISVSYNSSDWELVKNSEKCGLKKGMITAQKGYVRVLWDTTEKTEISDVIMTASFKKLNENAAVDDIKVTVNDYYDNTVEMNDIPYDINYSMSDNVRKISNISIPLIIIAVIIVLLVGAMLFFMKKYKISFKDLVGAIKSELSKNKTKKRIKETKEENS